MIRRTLRRWAHRLLLLAGAVYLLNLAVLGYLWRHRHRVLELLAEAAADLGRRPK